MASKPAAITGYSVCNGAGTTRAEVRDALYHGRRGLSPCAIELPFAATTGNVDIDLAPLEGDLAAWDTRITRLSQHLVRALDGELVRLRERWRKERIAVILGTTTAGADCTEAAYKHYLEHGTLPAGYDLWRQHTYGAVLYVMRALCGAEGPSYVVSTACTASAKPMAAVQRLIAADIIDAAVVGGVDTLCSMTLRGFASLDAMSTGPCRPFSAERSGLNLGEGGALLLLEREGDAMALLESVGESSDAYHITAPHPKGEGAELAMRRALELAGCDAADIDHINAHGTGTPLNDAAEAAAIERVFGCDVPVVSTKGYTGHTLGAAGATEAALALITLSEGWVPSSVGADPVDDKINVRIATERMQLRARRVLSNSFAFGGNNTAVLLRAV